MRNNKFNKGNIHRKDHLRALVTDTYPADVPIIFSNDGFYNNAKDYIKKSFSSGSLEILDRLLGYGGVEKYTIPYRYRITKNAVSTRRLSLVHPKSQLKVCEFYGKYEELICYYGSRTNFSIRSPVKVASTFFFKCSYSERNKYKSASIDTLDFDKRVRNPASYFSYSGVDRKYKFFESDRYRRLEKKFKVMWLADVNKCFDSIYTHTLPWAVKDIAFSKESVRYQSFGSEFDKLMQSQNYNETNGIIIGPETSRIFAEIIFQKIDILVQKEAKNYGLREHIDFACIRYVDDIIIFAKNTAIAEKIYSIFEECLGRFNLHLNDLKLDKYTRPFYTRETMVIHGVKGDVLNLQKTIAKKVETLEGNTYTPKHLYRINSIIKGFISDVKYTCSLADLGGEMASNYIITCLSNTLETVVDGYELVQEDERPDDEEYIKCILLVLEIQFFFYTVQPAVHISFKLARAIVLSINFIKRVAPERQDYILEQLSGWIYDLLNSLEDISKSQTKIPIEVLNIILCLSDVDNDGIFNEEFINRTILRSKKPDYFAIISFLYFCKNKPAYRASKEQLVSYINEYFAHSANISQKAHDAHLFFDVVACPFIAKGNRVKLVKSAFKNLDINPPNNSLCENIVSDLGKKSWFVNWNEIDLLNMIRRKELSSVY